MKDYALRTTCRLCNGIELNEILRLPATPLANEFLRKSDKKIEQDFFPLFIAVCRNCGHIQLPVVVDPKRLFWDYPYVSGTNKGFVNHFKSYAEQTIEQYNVNEGDLVVEIGSNDGTALKFYRDLGMRIIGVDPAKRIAQVATNNGIPTIETFFDDDTVSRITIEHGYATVVLANNVFAHIDDLRSVALNIKKILCRKKGIFRFEVQYGVLLLENCLFDMIYHEHLSYHTLKPLVRFFRELEMSVIDAELVATHGGSIRVTVCIDSNKDLSAKAQTLIRGEERIINKTIYSGIPDRIMRNKNELKRILSRFHKIIGFGAPAKLTTLCYTLGLSSDIIEFIVDDNPLKQGLITPGTGIPILSTSELDKGIDKGTGLLLFAWNFADYAISRFPEFRGSFILPMPEPAIL